MKNAIKCRIQKSGLSYTGMNHKKSSYTRKKSFPCTLPAAVSPHLRGSVQSRTPHPAFGEKSQPSLLKLFDNRFVFEFEIVPPAFLPIVKNQPCWTLKSTLTHSWLLKKKKMMMMWLSWSFRKNSSAWS